MQAYVTRLRRAMREHWQKVEHHGARWEVEVVRLTRLYGAGTVELRIAKGESLTLADEMSNLRFHREHVMMYAATIQAELAAAELLTAARRQSRTA